MSDDAFSDDEEFASAAAELISNKKEISINWRCLQGMLTPLHCTI